MFYFADRKLKVVYEVDIQESRQEAYMKANKHMKRSSKAAFDDYEKTLEPSVDSEDPAATEAVEAQAMMKKHGVSSLAGLVVKLAATLEQSDKLPGAR